MKKSKQRSAKLIIAGMGFVTGLSLSGAEGPIYINFIGLAVVLFSCLTIYKEG